MALIKMRLDLFQKIQKISVFLKDFFNYLAETVFSGNNCCFQNLSKAN
jgi:hypothetical protein